ncbi:TraR/DksA family transcriptional regulator [Jidongwangia harbinensis]|uniref:TraR/DksA family transcriptional regulator n=1 Tax=Jidongwangia harbinensis TaxID=2878561 RepID=UPI001CD9A171|nr:conjugal transfer protein TraR [Jidongwangia harbinensis]MCA2218903.1 conjugal transfer protein TraR [Jidongwangia harbinensis]
MTTSQQPAEEALHRVLERHYRTYTDRLTRLSVHRIRPDQGGYDDGVLDVLIAWARQGVADAARALQRMSDGTYGVCERCRADIDLPRLTGRPEIPLCGSCTDAPADLRSLPIVGNNV